MGVTRTTFQHSGNPVISLSDRNDSSEDKDLSSYAEYMSVPESLGGGKCQRTSRDERIRDLAILNRVHLPFLPHSTLHTVFLVLVHAFISPFPPPHAQVRPIV